MNEYTKLDLIVMAITFVCLAAFGFWEGVL